MANVATYYLLCKLFRSFSSDDPAASLQRINHSVMPAQFILASRLLFAPTRRYLIVNVVEGRKTLHEAVSSSRRLTGSPHADVGTMNHEP